MTICLPGSNLTALDYDIYNILQRDMMVDGGLRPVKEEDVIEVRRKAGRAVAAVLRYLELAEVSEEEIEAVAYANGSEEILPRTGRPISQPARKCSNARSQDSTW